MGSLAETATGEAQLYERNCELVYRYCLRMLRSREDAEDATQNTFVQAVRALRRGVAPTFEQAWLLAIAKNECRSRHRASARRGRLELVRDPQALAEVAAAPNGHDGTLIGVEAALARLPEMQRHALLLREWQGRSYAEIAAELGVTVSAVEALLFRARRSLARELGEEATTSTRHGFDLASLLGPLKSALGGGAAVKIAAGVAAVATVGAVAGSTEQQPAPVPTVPAQAVTANATRPTVKTARPSAVGARAGPKPARSEGRTRSAPHPAPSRSAPTAPSTDRAGGHAPAPPVTAPAPPPNAPPAEAPEAPTPQPQTLPTGQLPQAPQVPQVPQGPDVPEVPELPQVPQLPQVPSLPAVPDLPSVPDVPTLP